MGHLSPGGTYTHTPSHSATSPQHSPTSSAGSESHALGSLILLDQFSAVPSTPVDSATVSILDTDDGREAPDRLLRGSSAPTSPNDEALQQHDDERSLWDDVADTSSYYTPHSTPYDQLSMNWDKVSYVPPNLDLPPTTPSFYSDPSLELTISNAQSDRSNVFIGSNSPLDLQPNPATFDRSLVPNPMTDSEPILFGHAHGTPSSSTGPIPEIDDRTADTNQRHSSTSSGHTAPSPLGVSYRTFSDFVQSPLPMTSPLPQHHDTFSRDVTPITHYMSRYEPAFTRNNIPQQNSPNGYPGLTSMLSAPVLAAQPISAPSRRRQATRGRAVSVPFFRSEPYPRPQLIRRSVSSGRRPLQEETLSPNMPSTEAGASITHGDLTSLPFSGYGMSNSTSTSSLSTRVSGPLSHHRPHSTISAQSSSNSPQSLFGTNRSNSSNSLPPTRTPSTSNTEYHGILPRRPNAN